MIYSISIENFYSIADKQELSFTVPKNAPDVPAFLTPEAWPDVRIPAVIGFFGANASGKTTVLRALWSVVQFVRFSFALEVSRDIPFFTPYRTKEWWEKPTKIVVEFEGQLKEEGDRFPFKYTLHIGHKKRKPGTASLKEASTFVEYEALSYAPKGSYRRLFERREQAFEFGQEFGLSPNDPRVKAIRNNASTLSALAQFNHEFSTFTLATLVGVRSNILGLHKPPHPRGMMEVLSIYADNPTLLKGLNKEWKRLDIGLEEMFLEDSSQQGGHIAKFKHIGLDAPIDLFEESMGTRKFIEIFTMLHIVLETGATAIIDELDTDLHPVLIPELFRWFYDKERNPHNAQLIFTAHNASLLDDLEKEQVFLTQKRMGEPSCLYGVKDIKGLRREPSLTKKYLAGELGAIPHIG